MHAIVLFVIIGLSVIQLICNFENEINRHIFRIYENVRELQFILTDIEPKVQTPRARVVSVSSRNSAQRYRNSDKLYPYNVHTRSRRANVFFLVLVLTTYEKDTQFYMTLALEIPFH